VSARLHPAFHDRIHSRHLDPAQYDLAPGVHEHGVKQAGELAVAIPDQEPHVGIGILKIHDEVFRSLGYPGCNGMRGRAEDADPPAGVLDDRQHVQAAAGKVTVSKKSQASSASAWERRKSAQVAVVRSGAGSIPAWRRISHTVEAAIPIPRTRSSPWMRR
jgi:hypothetical protein